MVDAWRDALLKVKAVRARTGGGWRAEVAGRTRQTSARLLASQPIDEAALPASLSPREQRLQRIVHEVRVRVRVSVRVRVRVRVRVSRLLDIGGQVRV